MATGPLGVAEFRNGPHHGPMTDAASSRSRHISAMCQGYAEFADMGMLVSLAAAATAGAYDLLRGGEPSWASVAGAAVSAAYFAIPALRALGRGLPGLELPPAILTAVTDCAVQAVRDGDSGLWAVHDRGRGTTRFMTPREFTVFRSRMPEGAGVAVVEADEGQFHVKRYVGGAMHSTGDVAAHRVFDADGTLVRAVDYERGAYSGERTLDDEPAGLPAP